MKQGSADDPFADDPSEETPVDTEPEVDTDSSGAESGPSSPEINRSKAATGSFQNRSLPYIHSRDGVKDGRTQRPIFLRDHIESGIDDLVIQMEEELGEKVYKTDITEAAMAIAQEHPELVQEKLYEWGYGWD